MSKIDEITETLICVMPGDIVTHGSSWFKVIDVREPTHPAAPGMVLEGYTYSHKLRDWWPKVRIWHVIPDTCPFVPRILSPEDREALKF